jgi:TM2 domain-containing membrane protein YozV
VTHPQSDYPAQPPAPIPAGYPAPHNGAAQPPVPYGQPAQPVPYGQYAPPPAAGPNLVRSLKEIGIAYLFLIFLGGFGAHQFYLGKTGRGLLYLFTLGGVLGIGCLIDLFTLPSQVRQVNAQIASGVR